jgi:peptidoglycan/LPS O-acetylase OafA/YrhL
LPAHRYPTLDLLRVVAIGMTMLVHLPNVTHKVFFLRPFADGMWLGVDLFMLISGWLLGGQLLREAKQGTLRAGRFYGKRWLRTLPPYYAMLAILYFGHGPQFGGPLPWPVVLEHMTFSQVYAGRNEYLVSWSLCVEEHFYLVLPLVVGLLARRPSLAAIVALVGSLEMASVFGRFATYSSATDIPFLTHLRCDGLFLGLLLAWINLDRPALWQELGRFAGVIGVFGIVSTLVVVASIAPKPSPWRYIGAPLVGTWTLALVFFACVHDRCRWSRVSFPGLRYLGELTYSIYLVHYVLPQAWLGARGAGGPKEAVLRLALVLGLSMLLHHLVERPALRLREWVFRRPVRVPEAEGEAL